MAMLEADSGTIEIADDVHALILQLAADVARKRVMTMEPVALGAFTVDIGGPGVPYGTIRLKSGEQVIATINETRAIALSEKFPSPVDAATVNSAPETRSAAPNVSVASPNAVKTMTSSGPPPTIFEMESPAPAPAEDEAAMQLSQQVGSRLASLILHAAEGRGRIVSEKEIQIFRNWLDRFIEEGSGPEIVEAVQNVLQSPETPPLLKARLFQMMVKSSLPGIQQILAEAMHERQLRLILNDPRIRSGLKSFLDGVTEK